MKIYFKRTIDGLRVASPMDYDKFVRYYEPDASNILQTKHSSGIWRYWRSKRGSGTVRVYDVSVEAR